MYKLALFVAGLLLAPATVLRGQDATADTASLSGTILTHNGKPFTDAVIFLNTAADSTMVKTEITDEQGLFRMLHIQKGAYFVTIMFNNALIYSGSPFSLPADLELQPITVAEPAKKLDEIVINKQKQYIERQQGKLVLNVQQSLSAAGSSGFEILERAPGINIDNNDNISLRGRGGVAVHIDGRPVPMTGTNLANYLRGIPAGSIEKIELVYNPSAKYDAAGSSIINIVLKKDKNMGTNGSVTSAYTQGSYSKFNNSFSLNHRGKKTNFFSNVSHADRRGFNDLQVQRYFYDENGAFTGSYDQDNFNKITLRNINGRAGVDYYPNKNHTLGFSGTAGSTWINYTTRNFSPVYDAGNTYISRFETRGINEQQYDVYSANFNHRYVMDTIGSAITSDADYARYNSGSDQNFDTRYYDTGTTQIQDPYLLYGDINGKLDIYAAKSDFRTTLRNRLGLEAGVKSSYVVADNAQAFFDRSNGGNMPDPTKSNRFIYKENINAAYTSLSGEWGKWGCQLGLRVENTNIRGRQVADNTEFTNSYTQLFPNVYASYALTERHGLEFSYNRRITRAGYDQLNPFRFYTDPTTYREGNPYLLPQTTHTLDFTHSFDKKIYTTLSFSRTTDNITDVILPSETDNQVTIQGFRNLNTVDYYIIDFVVPLQVTPWWSSTNNLAMYQSAYSGMAANTTLSNRGNFTGNINSVNIFKLTQTITAELSGNYRARETYAFMDIRPIWRINGGIEKKFSNRSILKLSFTDVFFTGITDVDVAYQSYKEHYVVTRDNRTIALSYTYNFGSGQAARRRAGASDDIKQRAGSGSA